MSSPTERTRYGAPALEKGLEVIELLAAADAPMAMAAIAGALGRSVISPGSTANASA
jgi:hypothetical protein